jgi:hypothetical protein
MAMRHLRFLGDAVMKALSLERGLDMMARPPPDLLHMGITGVIFN